MNLKETFNQELLPQLKEKLGIDNVMAVPKLTKVVINMGVGEALTDKKHLDNNPRYVTKKDLIYLLELIKDGKSFG